MAPVAISGKFREATAANFEPQTMSGQKEDLRRAPQADVNFYDFVRLLFRIETVCQKNLDSDNKITGYAN